jgi:hypothetical protein
MILATTAILCALMLGGLLFLRESDLRLPAPGSPFHHLDERKAAIYENLRDLQFEYRVGKLSDADYQQTKTDLQKQLALVMAEVDRLKGELQLSPQVAPAPPAKPAVKAPKPVIVTVCASCGAEFGQSLKFCGECGAPIAAARGTA